jgi:hypothetical protein
MTKNDLLKLVVKYMRRIPQRGSKVKDEGGRGKPQMKTIMMTFQYCPVKGIREAKADGGRMSAVASLGEYRYLDAYDSGEDEFSFSWLIHHISANAYEVPSHVPDACVCGGHGLPGRACDHAPFPQYCGHVRAHAHDHADVRARGHVHAHEFLSHACAHAHVHADACVRAHAYADACPS